MNKLFLFGAGASYGSSICIPYRPPLGKDLFDELLNAGGIASTVKSKLKRQFRCDFEVGMEQFFEQKGDIVRFIREMSLYFVQFQPGINNSYIKLITSLRSAKHDVIFATTNYELLIELSANIVGLGIRYDNFRPFSRDTLNLLKIHGSCNFLPDMGTNTIHVGRIVMSSTAGSALKAPIKIANAIEEIKQFCNESSFAPAVAMYAPSKWVPICNDFVEKQREYWQMEVFRASHIFVIGCGVHERDSHIWHPLAKSLGFLTYIDPHPDGFAKWVKSNNRAMTEIIPCSFEEAIPLIEKRLSSLGTL